LKTPIACFEQFEQFGFGDLKLTVEDFTQEDQVIQLGCISKPH